MNQKIPIYVINVKTDMERKKHMIAQCQKHHLHVKFLDAVNGLELNSREIENVYSSNCAIMEIGRELISGEIGCALSHRNIYQKIIDFKIEKAIVFEDDIVLAKNFLNLIEVLQELPSEIECLLLGHNADIEKDRNLWLSQWGGIPISSFGIARRPTKLQHGTYGYLITYKGAQKLLKATRIIDRPIDHYTGDYKFTNLYVLDKRYISIHNKYNETSMLAQKRRIHTDIGIKHFFYRYFNAILKFRLKIKRIILRYLPIRKYK